MTTDADLKERFDRLAPPPAAPDWAEVTRRARELARSPRSGRRRPLLLAAALLALLALAGAALALTGSTTGVPAIDRILDHGHAPGGGPRVTFQPRAGSLSERLEFRLDGVPHTAIGFRNRQDAVCTAEAASGSGAPRGDGGASCLKASLLRDALAKRAVHVFAGGGGRHFRLVGFARADVERILARGPGAHGPATLSPPWSPKPWRGEPIRFFYVFFEGSAPEPKPGHFLGEELRLTAQLADGRVVHVRR